MSIRRPSLCIVVILYLGSEATVQEGLPRLRSRTHGRLLGIPLRPPSSYHHSRPRPRTTIGSPTVLLPKGDFATTTQREQRGQPRRSSLHCGVDRLQRTCLTCPASATEFPTVTPQGAPQNSVATRRSLPRIRCPYKPKRSLRGTNPITRAEKAAYDEAARTETNDQNSARASPSASARLKAHACRYTQGCQCNFAERREKTNNMRGSPLVCFFFYCYYFLYVGRPSFCLEAELTLF